TLLDTSSHRAQLPALLHNECRAAFRTGLGNRQVRRREIALGVLVASIEGAPASLPGNPLQQLAGLALGALDAQGLRADELAFGIGGAAGEFAILAVLLDQLRTALGALFIEQFVRLQGLARARFQAARRLA